MKIQQLYSHVRRAIDDYEMINDGDKIAIGISGGKDSMALLYALVGIQRFYEKKFDIIALSVDLGFDGLNFDIIKEECEKLHVPYHIVHTEIGKIVFEERKEHSPCSLCAKMRKGALNQAAKDFGCNKVAYAHHMDDIVETMFLSLIYEGRFYCFPPVTYLERMDLTVIRPMIYVLEADVIGFKNKYDISVIKNPCPQDGVSRREYAKQLVRQINMENPGAKKEFLELLQKEILMDGRIKELMMI